MEALLASLLSLEGRVVLIASGGNEESALGNEIGPAVAHLCAIAGAAIAYADRDLEWAADVAGEIVELGQHAEALQGSLTDAAAATALVERVVANQRRLDVAVAVIDRPIDPDDDRVCLLPLGAPLCERGDDGCLVVVTTWPGSDGPAMTLADHAGRLGALVHGLQTDLRPRGIRVNGVVVGPGEEAGLRDREDELHRRRKPGGADGAKPVLFLASELASYVSGQVLVVDGGWSSSRAT